MSRNRDMVLGPTPPGMQKIYFWKLFLAFHWMEPDLVKGTCMKCKENFLGKNTRLVAKGALAHRLQLLTTCLIQNGQQGPQNGRGGLESGVSLGFWSKDSFFEKRLWWRKKKKKKKRENNRENSNPLLSCHLTAWTLTDWNSDHSCQNFWSNKILSSKNILSTKILGKKMLVPKFFVSKNFRNDL